MKDTAFLDSNIWIYSFLRQDKEKREKAKSLIESLKAKKLIFSSPQILNEVCFNLYKNGIPEIEIREIIESFYSDLHMLDFTSKMFKKASNLREKYSLSFWDSLVVSAALAGSCRILYSEDMQHNQLIEKKLKIINPFMEHEG